MNQVPKSRALQLLQKLIDEVPTLKNQHESSSEFSRWNQTANGTISQLFGSDCQPLKDFRAITYSLGFWTSSTPDSAYHSAYVRGLQEAQGQIEALKTQIEDFWPDSPQVAETNVMESLSLVFERFHQVARQLRQRHDGRPTLSVSDEYDLQDLLHALLKLYFDDIRAEEWTPSYAGGASRVDFLLSEHDVVIEVKKTRGSMTARGLGAELIVDITRYKAHPQTKTLCCFVYDPEGLLPNPTGIERDLSGTKDGIDVRCWIRPK